MYCPVRNLQFEYGLHTTQSALIALLTHHFHRLSVLGTSHDGGYSHDAVVYALRECGVRHIDTAKRYGCEEHLSKSIQQSGVLRQDLWLTTKLWPGDYGYRTTKEACRASCGRLGVEYLGKFASPTTVPHLNSSLSYSVSH